MGSRAESTLAFLMSLIRSDWHIMQIGANDHVMSYGHDAVPGLIRAGLRATLYEPNMKLAAHLQAIYRTNANVTVDNRIVAEDCGVRSKTFYSLAQHNETGTHNSLHADVRCSRYIHWVNELSSTSKAHLTKHQNNLLAYTPHSCRLCSRQYGTHFGPHCLSRVILDNVVAHQLPSVCSAQLPTADVLFVDAEGEDARIVQGLSAQMLARLQMVIMETIHLSQTTREQLKEHLLKNHMRCAMGCSLVSHQTAFIKSCRRRGGRRCIVL